MSDHPASPGNRNLLPPRTSRSCRTAIGFMEIHHRPPPHACARRGGVAIATPIHFALVQGQRLGPRFSALARRGWLGPEGRFHRPARHWCTLAGRVDDIERYTRERLEAHGRHLAEVAELAPDNDRIARQAERIAKDAAERIKRAEVQAGTLRGEVSKNSGMRGRRGFGYRGSGTRRRSPAPTNNEISEWVAAFWLPIRCPRTV